MPGRAGRKQEQTKSNIEVLTRWTKEEVAALPSDAPALAIADAAARANQRFQHWLMIRQGYDDASIAACAIENLVFKSCSPNGILRRKVEEDLIPKVARILVATHQPAEEYEREESSKETASKLASFTNLQRKALRVEFETFSE